MFNKILKFYTKYFVIWVIVGAVLAFNFPFLFTPLRLYMELFFSITMLGIGAVLNKQEIQHIAKTPLIVFLGSLAQFTIMPLGAFFISKIFSLPAPIALGLIITGCAPGAMASNVICYIAGADTAYSVSLTTVSTLLTPIITPTLIYLLANSIMDVPFWGLFLSVIKMVVLPLIAGFWIRDKFGHKIEKFIEICPAISVTFIVFICSLVIALNKNYLIMITGIVLFAVIILNIFGMSMGYIAGILFRMDKKRKRTLSIEIGMQNAGMGTVLALKHFGQQSAIPAAAFVFVCIFTASIVAEIWQKFDNK
ncbi:bile acid:sodium symporter family protein [bacterium]|nr:bile acid:sodium symporter family protein [bacterium]